MAAPLTKTRDRAVPGVIQCKGRASRYRCSASQSMSFRVWIFRPETEEMKPTGHPPAGATASRPSIRHPACRIS